MKDETIRVSLDLFEGPLDLLLHLIQEQHIEIAAIPIASITAQYLEAVEIMQEMNLDIAGEYLVMAASLILIKSRWLLPPSGDSADEMENGQDPREELIERLKHYQLFREAGQFLGDLNEEQRDKYRRIPREGEQETQKDWVVNATVVDLLRALQEVFDRIADDPVHIVSPNPISVREKMTDLMKLLESEGSVLISRLFKTCSSKQEAIAMFLAVLELTRMQVIQARQRKLYGDIRVAILPNRS